MSELIWLEIIKTGGILIAALFSYLAHRSSVKTHRKINSRMDQLLEVETQKSRAEGVLEGTAQEKARDKSIT